jgi:hypothetical protein
MCFLHVLAGRSTEREVYHRMSFFSAQGRGDARRDGPEERPRFTPARTTLYTFAFDMAVGGVKRRNNENGTRPSAV